MTSSNIEHTMRPAEIVARRVLEARTSRGWSQAELTKRLQEIGYDKSRSTLAKLEGGRYRNVAVDDVFAIAAALGISPLDLMTPIDEVSTVAVAPKVHLPVTLARAWFRGFAQPPMLPEIDYRQVPKSELRLAVRANLTRGWAPVTIALAKEGLDREVERIVKEIYNPPKED